MRFKKIGIEKNNKLKDNFDSVYDKYKEKAEKDGYFGELKFIKEKSRVFIFTEINYLEE